MNLQIGSSVAQQHQERQIVGEDDNLSIARLGREPTRHLFAMTMIE